MLEDKLSYASSISRSKTEITQLRRLETISYSRDDLYISTKKKEDDIPDLGNFLGREKEELDPQTCFLH